MTTTGTVRGAFAKAVFLAASFILATPAVSQNAAPPPIHSPVDGNAVDVARGVFVPPETAISIGHADQYSVSFSTNRTVNLAAEVESTNIYIDDYEGYPITLRPNYIVFVMGNKSRYYARLAGGNFSPNVYDGSTITFSGGVYTYRGYDGVVVSLSKLYPNIIALYRPSSIVYPDGARRDFYYRGYPWVDPGWNGIPKQTYQSRINAVVDSRGYMIKFVYEGNTLPTDPNSAAGQAFIRRQSVQLLNRSRVTCDSYFDICSTGAYDWPVLEYTASMQSTVSTRSLTDSGGRVTSYSYDFAQGGQAVAYTNQAIRANNTTVTYNPMTIGVDPALVVVSLVRPAKSFSYSWSTTGPGGAPVLHGVMSDSGGVLHSTSADVTFSSVLLDKDALNRSTSYLYDIYWRAKRQTLPAGNYIDYTYDARGNVTQTLRRAIPGSGAADIVTSAVYPATCSNPVTCNKPTSTTDANGGVTEYVYDPVHGGVLTATGPVLADGKRSQIRYQYTQVYPRVLNASMVLVNSTPVWMLTRTSECTDATAGNPASCVGTAAERVVTYTYDDNLLKASETVTTGAGSPAMTTAFEYDHVGNVTAIDGPGAGTADKSYVTYDELRRPVFEIGPDPDHTGPLTRQMVRHVYDADGHEITTEYGSGASVTGADFVAARFRQMTYDPVTGYLVKTVEGQP